MVEDIILRIEKCMSALNDYCYCLIEDAAKSTQNIHNIVDTSAKNER